MTKFEKDLQKLSELHIKVNKLTNDMNDKVRDHLGDNWFVTYAMGDGILLCSPDASNYIIDTYVDTIGMERDEAIEYIESYPFN